LAIDEQRADFSSTHWNERAGVEERWFAGTHADVGGGYPECGLSDSALQWMKGKLQTSGLFFSELAKYQPQLNELLPIHEPWNEPLWLAGKRYVRAIAADSVLDDTVARRLKAALADYPTEALRQYLAAGQPDTRLAWILNCHKCENAHHLYRHLHRLRAQTNQIRLPLQHIRTSHRGYAQDIGCCVGIARAPRLGRECCKSRWLEVRN
jgi:T6SS, Phospholipase effector Tle1-like, catalytic domain